MSLGKRFLLILLGASMAILIGWPGGSGRVAKQVGAAPGSAMIGSGSRTSPREQPETLPEPQAPTSPDTPKILFESLSIADGLSQSTVTAILQDRQGFLWFGTEGGLNRYDGYEFTVYKHDPNDPGTLADNHVNTIFEDGQGDLWIGTNRGLDRFDPEAGTFVHYQNRPGDPNSLSVGAVLAILEDEPGTLWVGTTGGLNRFDRTTGTFTHYQHRPGDPTTLSNDAVWAIHEDRQGALWIGTNGGLDRLILGADAGYDPASVSFAHYRHDPDDANSLNHNRVRAILEDRQGALWIGTDGGGLNRILRGDTEGEGRAAPSFELFEQVPSASSGQAPSTSSGQAPSTSSGETPSTSLGQGVEGMGRGPSDNRVTSLWEDSAGRLWVGTRNGLDVFVRSAGSGQVRSTSSGQGPSASSGQGQGQGQEQGQGEGRGGFIHYRHELSDPQSLSDDSVYAVYEDRSGVLWVGTQGGLSKQNRTANRFALYQQGSDLAPELSDNLVQAVFEDPEGVVWVGTFGGGLNRLDRRSGSLAVYRSDPDDATSLSSDDVRAIYQDGQGVLWVGTDQGLDRLEPGTETFVRHPAMRGNRVTVIRADRSGRLWIGTSAGLFRLDPGSEDLVAYDDRGLQGDYVSAIYEDQYGAAWVGTYGGGINLWADAEGQFVHYGQLSDDVQSLSSDNVLAFYEDTSADGRVMWMGTEAGGLIQLDREGERFTRYTEKEGLPGDTVGCILADGKGTLWLGTNKGLSRFDPQTEAFSNYDARDGLQRGEFVPGACFQSARGEMFFAGFQGFNAFYPEQIEPNSHIPPLVVTAFDKFNQALASSLRGDTQIRLSYQNNYVSFEFAALDYVAPEKNQYAFMMEGIDEGWVFAGTRRYQDYPSLRPGDYVFRVRGSNNDGVWNEQAVAIRVTVTPPWWDTLWFRGAVLLVLAVGLVGGFRLRVRSLQARSRELERQVIERTQEIEQRRQVAEGLRDILDVLNSNRPLDEILDYVVVQAGRLLGSGASVLHRIERERQFVAVEASHGLADALRGIEGFPLYSGRADRVILNRQPFIARNLQGVGADASDDGPDDAQAERWLAVTGEAYRSYLAVPLVVEDAVYGYVAFYYTEAQTFTEEEIGLAVAFADQAALAIENAGLRVRAEDAAVAAERNRLARDMHDSVTQSLFSLTLLAEAGQRMIAAKSLEDIEENQALLSQIARQALQEMRLMVYELRPVAWAGEGLEVAIERRLEAVERRAGVEARLAVEGSWDLPADVEEELYRIAHEALNNGLKHANATRVDVTVRAEGARLALEIKDNGRGFDPEAVRSREGMGLTGMRERAENIGGSFSIRSAPGEGTTVRVVVRG